jgi:NADH-quinone oxidoreductase subunit N
MVIGNLFAISQTNLKRMLAYSSIAHAGYMLAGLAAGNALGKTGVLFYMATYTFMNLGAFGIIALLEYEEEKNLLLSDYAGLSARRPFVAALMAVFMFSLSGLPPFGGFFGKYYIFLAAINANLTWLAIVGVLASLIGVYYYIRVVVMMCFAEAPARNEILPSPLSLAIMTVVALVVLQVGVYPSTLLSIIQHLF